MQKLLLSTQMVWVISMKTLNNTIQIKNEEDWLCLMIRFLMCLATKYLVQKYLLEEEN